MKYDSFAFLFTELALEEKSNNDTEQDVTEKHNRNKNKVDDLVTQGKCGEISINDIAARIQILTVVAANREDLKEYVVAGDRKQGGGYKSLVHDQNGWRNSPYVEELIKQRWQTLQKIGLIPAAPDLSLLPPGAWFLQFKFTLAKPWISKDDDPFYVAESVNPVRKDKVFKVPVMAASSWKGLLRWTLMQARLALRKDTLTPERFAQERFVQTLLFGDEQGEEPGQVKGFAQYVDSLKPEAKDTYREQVRSRFGEEDQDDAQDKANALPRHSGRLSFYPTFFDGIDVEVINPHSRKTRAGTKPIYLESVPAGASGTFSLLYVPFDLIGQDEDIIRKQAAEDLQIVAEGLKALFLTYGFSAKRTSGFGVAETRLEHGKLTMNAPDPSPAPSQPIPAAPSPSLPKYLEAPGRLKAEYLNPDGTFRERSQAELNAMAKPQRQEYDKAKKWWEREGKALAESPQAEPEAPSPAPAPASCLEREFSSFDELKQKVDEVANAFKAGGGQ